MLTNKNAEGLLEFIVDDMKYVVESPAAIEHFETPGCTCRPGFSPLNPESILVLGIDDCPVHGFGLGEETCTMGHPVSAGQRIRRFRR